MAAILTLDKSIAPKLLRCLYTVALVVILIGTALGVTRGVRIMTMPPLTPPPAMAAASGAPPPMAGPGAIMGQTPGPGMRPMMMRRRGFGGLHPMRGMRFMPGMPRPAAGGIWIVLALLRGVVALLVVRIMAEMGLAVLSLKRD